MLLLSWLVSFLWLVKLDRVSCSAEFLSPWTIRSPEEIDRKVFGTEAARGAQPQASTERVSTPCGQFLEGYSPQKGDGNNQQRGRTPGLIQPPKGSQPGQQQRGHRAGRRPKRQPPKSPRAAGAHTDRE